MNASPEEVLFQLAMAKPAEKRAAFLDVMCDGDAALRQRLEALLAAHEQPETLLATQDEAARPTLKLDLADAPDEAVGQRLGRYKLLERVGEGGCGVVYVAEQTEPVRRRVALKVIKLGMDTKQVVARFEAERQALAMMDHPNIAKVLDAGTTDVGRPYFVMELVRGIKITDYCDQANLSTKDRLDLFIKVCQAIQHAHQKGIIHRDIKPSNILVTLHDGVPVPKVIDFGIAKATEGRLTDNTVYTQLHQFIGTPAYMSPEQAEMSGLDIDTRSDIYSLGVLLYELLAGSTPFDAKELMASGIDAMRKTIREKEPQRPSTRLATLGADQLTTTAKRRSADTSKLLHQLKGDLDWIVMKCLEKDRQRRYDTANGLAADITRHLTNEPVTARPPSAAYKLQKAFRRNKLVFAAAGAVMAVLVAGIAASTWQAVRATRAERAAEDERSKAVEERDRALKSDQQARAERAKAIEEKQRADTAAKVSAAVTEYLQKDVLAQASPNNEPDRDITLRTVFDRAAQKIEGRFTNQPAVEAEIRTSFAETYNALGEYGIAETHARRAVELSRSNFGAEHPATLKAQYVLADGYYQSRKTRECLELHQEVLRLRERVLGPEHPDTLESKHSVAMVHWRQGRFLQAEPLVQEALAARKRVLGPEHAATLSSMNDLALVYNALGRRAEATALMDRVVEISKRTRGLTHPHTLVNMANQALNHRENGNLAAAEALFREVIQLQTRVLGPDHPNRLLSMSSLASVYNQQGKRAEATALNTTILEAHQRILEARKKQFGLEHPSTIQAMKALADRYSSPTNAAERVALNQQIVDIQRRVLGPEHPDTLSSMRDLAMSLRRFRKSAEAGALFAQVLEVRQRVLGPEHLDTLTSMDDQAASLVSLTGKEAQRRGLFEHVLEIRKRVLGPEHPDTLQSMVILASSLRQAGRKAEAEALAFEAFEIQKRVLGPEHASTLIGMSALASAYRANGKLVEAEALLTQELAIHRRRPRGSANFPVAQAFSSLASLYQAQGQLAKAEALLNEQLDNERRTRGPDYPGSVTIVESLANLYHDQGRPGEAEKLLTNAIGYFQRTSTPAGPSAAVSVKSLLAEDYLEQGRLTELESLLKQTLEETIAYQRKNPQAPTGAEAIWLGYLGRLHLVRKDYAAAEKTLREAVEKSPDLVGTRWRALIRSALGEALSAQRRFADAEPLLLEGHEGLSEMQHDLSFATTTGLGRIQALLRESLTRLVRHYEASGQPTPAAEWRKRLDEFNRSEAGKPQ